MSNRFYVIKYLERGCITYEECEAEYVKEFGKKPTWWLKHFYEREAAQRILKKSTEDIIKDSLAMEETILKLQGKETAKLRKLHVN